MTMLKRFDRTAGYVVLQVGLIAAVLALWEGGVRAGLISAFLFGSPLGVARQLLRGLQDGSLLFDTWITLYEAILGFVIGTVAGSVLGLALW